MKLQGRKLKNIVVLFFCVLSFTLVSCKKDKVEEKAAHNLIGVWVKSHLIARIVVQLQSII